MEPVHPASGKILPTERLPGSLRILDTKGTLSAPAAGMAELASPGARDIGMLDVVLDSVIAPSGLACYTGNLFPPWQGPLFVGGGDPGSANVCRWPS